MKKTIKNIIIHILFLIFGFILASCSIDGIVSQYVAICGNLGANSKEISMPLINSIKSVQGESNDNNPFDSLYACRIFNVSGGWTQVYNYYGTDSLQYIVDGIQSYNVDTNAEFPSGNNQYAFDFSFNVPFIVNNYRTMSMIFGALGDLITIQSVQIGSSDYDNVNANFQYSELPDGWSYQLMFAYNGSVSVSFIRIWFQANIGGSQLTSDVFFKLFMYGLYTSVGGYPQGFEDGYLQGYDSGLADGITQGFDDGYYEGYDYGLNIGYDEGYNAGYDRALSEGISNPENVFYTIWSILTTCGDLLYQFFTTPLFGDVTIGFVFIIIPFGFTLIENIIKIIVKLVTMFLGGS